MKHLLLTAFSLVIWDASAQINTADFGALDSANAVFERNRGKLNEKNGFRDLKFGTPITAVKGLVALAPASHGSRTYQRPSDAKKIGKYALSSITYTFYKGQLSRIHIDTDDYLDSRGVLEAFQALYGPGRKDNDYIEEYQWTSDKVLMHYEQNPVTGDATISIRSAPIMGIEAADEKNAAKKAAADL